MCPSSYFYRGWHLNNEISDSVFPLIARSAAISPMTGQNLKPCPLHALINITLSLLGCISNKKCPSLVIVYMHVFAFVSLPFKEGTCLAKRSFIPCTSFSLTFLFIFHGEVGGSSFIEYKNTEVGNIDKGFLMDDQKLAAVWRGGFLRM